MAELGNTTITGTLNVTENLKVDGNIVLKGNATATNITSMQNEISELNSSLSNILQKTKNFITAGVAGNSSITLEKPAQYNYILIIFRGNGVDLFTIDKWNQIGEISGDKTSGMSISCTNSGDVSASTVTLTNTTSSYRNIWGVFHNRYN